MVTSSENPTPIVLLHGVGLDRSMWRAVIEQLPRPTVALDLPGHGGERVLREPTTLAELARRMLAQLPDGRCHLVGFSLGALVAQHIARFSPERVATLTCVSSVCRRTPEEAAAVLDRLESAKSDFAGTVDRSIERWFAGGIVAGSVVQEIRAVLERTDVESFVHAYEVFATGDRDIADELERISAPTLAITGELDPGSTPQMTTRLAAAIPGARQRVVDGVRHMLPVQAPDVLVDELMQMINDAEGDGDD
ncbi:MAG: alpha/beta fold hydrolase [Agrococcus sp.]